MSQRPERLRASSALRSLVSETSLSVNDLVLPVFLNDQTSGHKEISSMPGVSQWSVQDSLRFIEKSRSLGIQSFMLFGIVGGTQKDPKGSAAWREDGPVPKALRLYKKEFGDLSLWADTCFCEYTDHGHCGVFGDSWQRDREKTLQNLKQAAIVYAQAGAEVIAPSGMVDGMVSAIREGLDSSGLDRTAICSYSVKYASQFYGPFREAAENAPVQGTDRKGYQMNPANRREAIREAKLDVEEGADLLMVKPGLPFLDIIRDVVNAVDVPVGAYQVSGEYAMIKAASRNGWLNEEGAFMESLIGLKRAGSKFIITYWANEAAEVLSR